MVNSKKPRQWIRARAAFRTSAPFLFTIYHSLFTPIPSPPAGFQDSTSNTVSVVLLSLPRSPSAASLAPPQTDPRGRQACATMVHRAAASETSDLIASKVVCATALCRRPSALRSLLPPRLQARLSEP